MTGAQSLILGAMVSIFAAFVVALIFGGALMEAARRYLTAKVEHSSKEPSPKSSRVKQYISKSIAAFRYVLAKRKKESLLRAPVRFRGRFYRSAEDAATLCDVELSEVLPGLEYTPDGAEYLDPWNAPLPPVAIKHRYVRIERCRKYRLCISEYEGGISRGHVVGNGERIPLDLIVPPGVNAEEDLYNEAVRVIQGMQ